MLAPVFGTRLNGELQLAGHPFTFQNPVFEFCFALNNLSLLVNLVLALLVDNFVHILVLRAFQKLPHIHVGVAFLVDLRLVVGLSLILEAWTRGKVDFFVFEHFLAQFIKYVANVFA